jgi:hypothetical protein
MPKDTKDQWPSEEARKDPLLARIFRETKPLELGFPASRTIRGEIYVG